MRVRRAERSDAADVASLFGASEWFPELAPSVRNSGSDSESARGRVQRRGVEKELQKKIEGDGLLKSILCVSVIDENDTLCAFASFDNTPQSLNDCASSTEDCLDHIRRKTDLKEASPSNTLFLTSWACGVGLASEAIPLVLRTVFETLPEKDFIVAFTDVAESEAGDMLYLQGFSALSEWSYSVGTLRSETHTPEMKTDNDDDYYGQDSKKSVRAWSFMRESVRPDIISRPAQVEDYDELVRIFDSQSQVLSKVYGEYFLAELIESQDKNNRAYVADLDGRAVGLLCLSSEIDIPLLARSYDLSAFNDLKRTFLDPRIDASEENVFAITMFCIDNAHHSRTVDLLTAAFEAFPDREYCVLTIPNDMYEPALLPYFFCVPLKDGAQLSHSLYMLHRDSLRAVHSDFLPISGEGKERESAKGSRMEVVEYSENDTDAVSELLHGMEERKTVLADLRKGFEGSEPLSAFVVRVLGQVVGLAIVENLDPESKQNVVISNFDRLFDLRNVSGLAREGPLQFGVRHGILRHFAMAPLFAPFARLVFCDVMRLKNMHALHYRLFPGERIPKSVADEFVQVRPRRVKYLQRRHRRNHLKEPRDRNSRHALFSLTKASLSEPRIVANTRVVVVGASEAGLSVLEELLTVPSTSFAKLTLIAPGGIPDERVPGVRELCTQGASVTYDARTLDRLGLRDRVTLVDDRMVYLERDSQAVVLADGSLLEYDYLVLATGLQDTTACNVLQITHRQRQECKPLADSVYSVGGNMLQATTMRRMIQAKHVQSKEQCLVYGASLEALSAVQALLTEGKPGKYVNLVNPLESEDLLIQQCFGGDEWAAHSALSSLHASGVKIISGLRLVGVERLSTGRIAKAMFLKSSEANNTGKGSLSISSRLNSGIVSSGDGSNAARDAQRALAESGAQDLRSHVIQHLGGGVLEDETDKANIRIRSTHDTAKNQASHSQADFVELPCGLLITANNKSVDPDIFASVNDNGLVYDGRLVVDAQFRTVDPRIYGCGSLVKFSRKLHAPLLVENYNSRETGKVVATSLLNVVDPIMRKIYQEQDQSLPTWYKPKVQAHSVRLPGGVEYIRASRPGWSDSAAKSKVLETNVPGAFCRIQVDPFGFVSCVSYGMRDEYLQNNAQNSEEKQVEQKSESKPLSRLVPPLEQLVGIHVSYLADIERLLECGEIPDLLTFLAKDWSAALFHDHFDSFAKELQTILRSDDHINEVVDELRQVYVAAGGASASESDYLDVAVKRNQLIGPGGSSLKGRARQLMQERMARFIKEHSSIMEQYMHTVE